MKIAVITPTLLGRHCLQRICPRYQVAAVVVLKETMAQSKSRYAYFDDLAEQFGFDLIRVSRVNDPGVIERFRSIAPDLILELGWSEIIPRKIIAIPSRGCVGVHGAILPDVRGGASMNWALIRGAAEWGVTLMYLHEKVDQGDIIGIRKFRIQPRDDIATVHLKSDQATADLLEEHLPLIEKGAAKRRPQSGEKFECLPPRKPSDGVIDWTKSAVEIDRWIRAQTHPFPGAFTWYEKRKLFAWCASLLYLHLPMESEPGTIVEIKEGEGLCVRTADGVILLTRIQAENDVEMWADEWAQRYGVKNGNRFG